MPLDPQAGQRVRMVRRVSILPTGATGIVSGRLGTLWQVSFDDERRSIHVLGFLDRGDFSAIPE